MNPRRPAFRLLHRLRVRWAEVDLQQIVFNGHYLMYLDTAVAEYWRAMALPYQQTLAHFGGDLYVRKATLEYEASARCDDLLDIGIRCARIGNSSLTLEGAVFRQDERLVSAELVYVFADPMLQKEGQASRPVPSALRAVFEAFEAGETMLDVHTGDWHTLGADAHAVRTEVFVEEQRIPADLEWDEADATALHAVARNRLGMPLATGRLTDIEPGIARIGRMAVRQPMRGGGAGRAVFDALIACARERGVHELRLNAQASAAGFYARAGFTPQGEAFDEAGIPHIPMARAI